MSEKNVRERKKSNLGTLVSNMKRVDTLPAKHLAMLFSSQLHEAPHFG